MANTTILEGTYGTVRYPKGSDWHTSAASAFRNRIINGCMRVDQKLRSYRAWGGPYSGVTTNFYICSGGGTTNFKTYPTLDKWQVDTSGYTTMYVRRVQTYNMDISLYNDDGSYLSTGTSNTPFMMDFSCQTGGGNALIYQAIESCYTQDLVNTTVNVSFSCFANNVNCRTWSVSMWKMNKKDTLTRGTGTIIPGQNSFLNDCILISYYNFNVGPVTFDSSGYTLPHYGWNFPIDDGRNGLVLVFNPFAQKSPTNGGTASFPLYGNDPSTGPTGSVITDFASCGFRLGQVQLTVGKLEPSKFDYRPITYELELCQRYTAVYPVDGYQTGYAPVDVVDSQRDGTQPQRARPFMACWHSVPLRIYNPTFYPMTGSVAGYAFNGIGGTTFYGLDDTMYNFTTSYDPAYLAYEGHIIKFIPSPKNNIKLQSRPGFLYDDTANNWVADYTANSTNWTYLLDYTQFDGITSPQYAANVTLYTGGTYYTNGSTGSPNKYGNIQGYNFKLPNSGSTTGGRGMAWVADI